MDGCELVQQLRANPAPHRLRSSPTWPTALSVGESLSCSANYLHHEVGPIAEAYGVAHVLTHGLEPQPMSRALRPTRHR